MPDAILPIVIAEERVTTTVQAVIILPEEALFIERINTQVQVDRCRVVNGAVLINGRVIINVPFKTGNLSGQTGTILTQTRVICGDLRHCTAFIPFSVIANVPGVQEGDECRVLAACVIDLITDLLSAELLGLGGPTPVQASPIATLGITETLGTMDRTVSGDRRRSDRSGMSGRRDLSGNFGISDQFGMSGRRDGTGNRGRSGRFGTSDGLGLHANLGLSGNFDQSGRFGTSRRCGGSGGRGRSDRFETSENFETTGSMSGSVIAAGVTGDVDDTGRNDRLAVTAEVCIRFRVTREETVDVRRVQPMERFVTFPSF